MVDGGSGRGCRNFFYKRQQAQEFSNYDRTASRKYKKKKDRGGDRRKSEGKNCTL